MYESGEHMVQQIAGEFGVTRPTIYLPARRQARGGWSGVVTGQAWVEQWFYDVVAVADLPTPEAPEDEGCLSRPVSGWRRRLRQLMPRRGDLDCCWYHGGDWHRASETAIRLVRAAEAAGVTGENVAEHVLAAAEAEGVTGWDLEALDSLITTGYAIILGDDPDDQWYVNGRHRMAAMLDAGVRQTIVARLELLDPATEQPVRE